MSELKAYTYDDMLNGVADVDIEYYSKSEADKVIAEKAIDYFKRIYCNPEKVVSYRFVESLGNSLKNLDKTAVG